MKKLFLILKRTLKRVKSILTWKRPGLTTICLVKDDKKAIVTFTADDGIYNSCVKYNELFKRYGLKGTFCLVTDWVETHRAYGDTDRTPNGANDSYCGTWQEWQGLLDQGHIDIANHSYNHRNLTSIDTTVEPDELDRQINGARDTLMTKLKGTNIIGMVNPYNSTNRVVDAVVKQHHYAERSGRQGYNTLDPDKDAWYALNYTIAALGISAAEMNSWVDDAIIYGCWCIEMWHGLDAEAWQPSTNATCNEHLLYLSSKLNDVWNATYTEAIQYIRERQHARLSFKTITRNEHYKIRLKLPPDYTQFDHPLTLKTQVPRKWTGKARIVQNGKTQYSEPQTKNGRNYIYYDAIPNRGDIDISKE